jgi:endonuclease/exonuclease/phosphatase family metal-dependent hydrolase
LVSAYHTFTGEAQGDESVATFRHMGSRHGTYHIDFCFIPKKWANRLASVEVGPVQGWRQLSDHAPLVVDVSIHEK